MSHPQTPFAPGVHILADFYGVSSVNLADPIFVEEALRHAANMAGAEIIHAHFHHFGQGMGVTGMLLLQESHISIHTWPETSFAAIDIFMCGTSQPQLALENLQKSMAPAFIDSQVIQRAEKQPSA